MAEVLVGKWQSVSYENIEPFWDVLGVPEPLRALARKEKTMLTIDKEGDAWKLTTVIGDKSRVSVFPVGQPVDTISLTGQAIKAVLTVEGSELVERQELSAGELVIKRGLVGGKFQTSMTLKGVTAVIHFSAA